MNALRQRVAELAYERNDTCASFLATHADVSLAEVFVGRRGVRNADGSNQTYRFTLPTGDDLDWEPQDGWDGPSSAMDAMAVWLQLEQRKDSK